MKKKYTINDIKIRRITNRAHIDMQVDFNEFETKKTQMYVILKFKFNFKLKFACDL